MAVGKHTNPRLYRIWAMMKQRCSNPRNTSYARYGGVGIGFCREWVEFGGFEQWAYASGYDDLLSLDRIDGSCGYGPDNCRWSTPTDQARNTKANINIEINGRVQCASAWANETGLKIGCLLRRFHLGWRGEVLLAPVARGKKRHSWKSVNHTQPHAPGMGGLV
jgi:hypothetical protein